MARTSSEDIFSLIRSLTKPEKRYFKMYVSMGNVKKNTIYARLFSAIEKQKIYNEQKILKKIPELKPQYLSDTKNYLGELVLESLQWYNSGKNVNARLRSLISNIEVLYSKGLFNQCNKQIKKAKAMAQHYQKYRQLAEIFSFEGNIITFTDKKEEREIAKVLTENIENAGKIKTEAEYMLLGAKILKLYRKEGLSRNKETRRKLNKIIKHPLLKSEKNLSSYQNYYTHNQILSICYHMLNNHEKFYSLQKKIIANFELYPHQVKEGPVTYITTLNNFIASCKYLGKEEDVKNILLKVDQLLRDPYYQAKPNIIMLLFGCYNVALSYYNLIGEFQKSIALTGPIEKSFLKLNWQRDKATLISCYYNIAYTYFGSANFKKTLFWLNKIINEKDTDTRNDIQVYARLLNLILHFELGNESELVYFTKSTYRFLLSKHIQYKIETIILEFIRKKIPRINTNNELLVSFSALKSEIEKNLKTHPEQEGSIYFDFVSWLESKITGKPFASVVKERWRKKFS